MSEPRAYYSENDPLNVEWLENLIAAGELPPGDVDGRDIRDVKPSDLRGYTQHHFFAGIGVWPHAFRRAGWPDHRRVASASCPCQPFSQTGKGGGFADERHLWPSLFHLIEHQRFDVIFGEQVASQDGLAWLDLVQTDLEGARYAPRSADICAAGVGAPHIRQRLWWVADNLVADADDAGSQGWKRVLERSDQRAVGPIGLVGKLADSDKLNGHRAGLGTSDDSGEQRGAAALRGVQDIPAGIGHNSLQRPGPTNSHWRDADWLLCRDGQWRPVEPGTFPLAHGAAGRVGRLRAYGNAIVAQEAEEWIRAYLDDEANPQIIDADFRVVSVAELLGE